MPKKRPPPPSPLPTAGTNNNAKSVDRWDDEGGAPSGGRLPRKRPRDFRQAAKLVVDIATGQVEDREPTPEEQGKDPRAVERGRYGSQKGGKARAESLSSEKRREISKHAAKARWSKLKAPAD